jgi:hypothetical protein
VDRDGTNLSNDEEAAYEPYALAGVAECNRFGYDLTIFISMMRSQGAVGAAPHGQR